MFPCRAFGTDSARCRQQFWNSVFFLCLCSVFIPGWRWTKSGCRPAVIFSLPVFLLIFFGLWYFGSCLVYIILQSREIVNGQLCFKQEKRANFSGKMVLNLVYIIPYRNRIKNALCRQSDPVWYKTVFSAKFRLKSVFHFTPDEKMTEKDCHWQNGELSK